MVVGEEARAIYIKNLAETLHRLQRAAIRDALHIPD